jgi:RNA polymerase sigma-70 factor, ECF subfamily
MHISLEPTTMVIPQTRHSLLRRLHDRADATAWSEFCAIYEPVIYRFAKRFGLQDADAREVSQEVLLVVSKKVELFDTQAGGRFRGWLSKIARHASIDLIRRRREKPVGGSDVIRRLSEIPRVESDESGVFLFEERQQHFQWAAEQIRQSSQPDTWQAFWLTAVECVPAIEVARRLGMTVGAVYVARCRTLARIKNLIDPFIDEEAP